jgi:hypothetical protein
MLSEKFLPLLHAVSREKLHPESFIVSAGIAPAIG